MSGWANTIRSKTLNYYRVNGFVSIVRKIIGRLLSVPERGHPTDLVPYPLLGDNRIVAQLIEVGLADIQRIEILLATFSRENNSQNRITLLDTQGNILADDQFSAEGIQDNHYYSVKLPAPISPPKDKRLIIAAQSLDGNKMNCIAIWRLKSDYSNVHVLSSSSLSDVVSHLTKKKVNKKSGVLEGGFVVRLSGNRDGSISYAQPEPPLDLVARLDKGVKRLAVLGTDANKVAKCLRGTPAEVSHVQMYSFAVEARQALAANKYDFLLLSGVVFDHSIGQLLCEAHSRYIPSAYYLDQPLGASAEASISEVNSSLDHNEITSKKLAGFRQSLHSTNFVLCADAEASCYATKEGKRSFILGGLDSIADSNEKETVWERMLCEYRRLFLPKVSIVTILYSKVREIVPVLESYSRQTYRGEIEIIFVDDLSPDNSATLVADYFQKVQSNDATSRQIEFKIVRNEQNFGNCISRNIGVREASGDILVIIDADCLLNADFIKRHVEAHAFDDCEVAIGPFNIETNGREPSAALKYYEERPESALAQAELQDPINRSSFLNCITRNFSIKAKAISEDLFDPLFGYSASPESGYGWEDVEMGYRLYLRGLRIKFIEDAFSIHISAEGEDRNVTKPLRSLRNYRRLFEKHSELGWVARRWSRETYGRICNWADSLQAGSNEDRKYLDAYFTKVGGPPALKTARKRYRVLTYRWHVPHQYELYKLPLDVTLLTGLGSPMTDRWEYSHRPLPSNAHFARIEDINPRNYDFAILHFDENVLSHENSNGVIGAEWGSAFRWLRENLDIPKVAVCHGTPQFYGQYNINYTEPNLMEVMEEERLRMVDYMGDIPVVVNSHQAQREWGFRKSRVIWHGFDPTEFPAATYERGILSPRGPLVMSRPHYRGHFLYKAVFGDVPGEIRPESLHVPDPHVMYKGNAYAVGKYRKYIDEIRRYSVYFNPTLRSPMPRARCEPMMCGVVTVSANTHDVDMFVQNGINGFYSNDPAELRNMLAHLMRNPDALRRIGAEARKTAINIFNHDRYLADWRKLIVDEVG